MRSVWCTWQTLALFLHCWIELWGSLEQVVTCASCVNRFQKQSEILLKKSSATKIDLIIPRIENTMLTRGETPHQLWKSINWNLGYESLELSWFFFSSWSLLVNSQRNGLVDSGGCWAWPKTALFKLVETLGNPQSSLLLDLKALYRGCPSSCSSAHVLKLLLLIFTSKAFQNLAPFNEKFPSAF